MYRVFAFLCCCMHITTSLSVGDFRDCINNAKPGDTCYIPSGNYTDFFIAVDSLHGSQNAPITIAAEMGGSVVIDGTIEMSIAASDWTQLSSNQCIYSTSLSEAGLIWQLFVDNAMMTPCRWPNHALWNDKSVFDFTVALAKGQSTSTLGHMIDDGSKDLRALNFSVEGGIAILNIWSSITTSAVITAHKANSNSFDYSYPNAWTEMNFDNDHARYYIENVFEFVDEETEFYVDTDANDPRLYLYTPECKHPSEFASIRGKQQRFAFNISKSSFIRIENITLFGISMNVWKSDDISLKNVQFLYPSFSQRAIGVNDATQMGSFFGMNNFSMINCVWSAADGSNFQYHGNDGYFYNNLFEYNSYSCMTDDNNNPGSTAGAFHAQNSDRDRFIQNTVINYGPSNGYRNGKHSYVYMCLFANQSNLQHDGAQIQVAPSTQNGTVLSHCWSYSSLKYGYRFDGVGDAHTNTWGYNGTMEFLISFNDHGIMIKGDYHRIMNNVGFNHTVYNNVSGVRTQPDICIRQKYANANAHTLVLNNGATNFTDTADMNDGCLYPLVGITHNNLQGPVAQQLRDVNNFDFRPIPGSVYAQQSIGAYLMNDTYYWIPGQQLTKRASFPIPDNGATNIECQHSHLMFRHAFECTHHALHLYLRLRDSSPESESESVDSENSLLLLLLDVAHFYGKQNIYSLSEKRNRNEVKIRANTTYVWRVDCMTSEEVIGGENWLFTIKETCA